MTGSSRACLFVSRVQGLFSLTVLHSHWPIFWVCQIENKLKLCLIVACKTGRHLNLEVHRSISLVLSDSFSCAVHF